MNKAFFISAEELAKLPFEEIPSELISSSHLIYSSPATLAFNSPGATGFGVKRAGLSIPESVMLIVAPACCGRNTAALDSEGYKDRFFYLTLDDTDIVTGRHLSKIADAVKEICDFCEKKPSAVMICITCIDALLGTDMKRVCKKASKAADVPVVPCYMYALTREGRLPPMSAVRGSCYSLLKKATRKRDSINILGFFSPLNDDCEIYSLLKAVGIKTIHEISRCKDFSDYLSMSDANFNLVLNSEARYAAAQMEKELGIPSIELRRMYQLEKIKNQYLLFAKAIGTQFDDKKYFNEAEETIEDFRKKYGKITFSVGEMINGDPFELSLALINYGFSVGEIFGTVSKTNFSYIKKISAKSPETKIYSNLSPSMLFYNDHDFSPDAVIGKDAQYYHKDCVGIHFFEDIQPFGYSGVKLLFNMLDNALSEVKR